MNNKEHKLMADEWAAWQQVVRAWPGNINLDQWDPLVSRIRFWAECLAELRHEQSDFVRQTAKRDVEVKLK